MGNTFTVEVWKQCDFGMDRRYRYEMTWQGESLLMALWQLFKAKRLGHGSTTLSWRGHA